MLNQGSVSTVTLEALDCKRPVHVVVWSMPVRGAEYCCVCMPVRGVVSCRCICMLVHGVVYYCVCMHACA